MLNFRSLLVIPVAMAISPIAAQATPIHCGNNLDAALNKAKASHTIVMVDFYTTWCYWCKQLDAHVYPVPSVESALSKIVPVKLDAEKNGLSAVNKYKVTGYPDLVFLDPQGNMISSITGYEPAPQFTHDVNAIVTRYHNSLTQLPLIKQELSKTPNSASLLSKEIILCAGVNDLSGVKAALPKLLKASGSSPSIIMKAELAVGDMYSRSGDYGKAVSHYKKALPLATEPKDMASTRISIASCYLQQNELKAALPELQAVVAIKHCPPSLLAEAQQTIPQIQNALKGKN